MTQKITQLEFSEKDFPLAEAVAKRLGFTQTAYTSTSALIGLFCLPDRAGQREGCIIKTREFGLMFVSDLEHLKMDDLNKAQTVATLPTMTDERKAQIGEAIADIFHMKTSREHKDRYAMTWGDKTALGVYLTFMRIAEDIETGTFKP